MKITEEQIKELALKHAESVWGVYFDDIDEDTNDSRGNNSINDFIAGYNAAANQSKWIYVKDKLPELIEGKNYSENVIAEVEGYTEPQIMCYIYVEGGFAWARVYDGLNGDAEFDDNYTVIKWQPIPKI